MVWAAAVTINCAATRDFAISEEGATGDRISVIPNGIRVEEYQRPMRRSVLQARWGLRGGGCLIGTVGRLEHQKGLDVLLKALALIDRGDIDLLIVGRGSQEGSLRAEAK